MDRAKLGTKRHVVCDRRGAPLGLVISGANRHDKKKALATIDAIGLARPAVSAAEPQHLCGDKGDDYEDIREGLTARGYTTHIPQRGEPKFTGERTHQPKRWVIERLHSWLNRYRRLLVRWEKSEQNYIALIYFAFALQLYRLIVLGYALRAFH